MGDQQSGAIQQFQLRRKVDHDVVARQCAELSLAFLRLLVPFSQSQDQLPLDADAGLGDFTEDGHARRIGNGSQRRENQGPPVEPIPGELEIVVDLPIRCERTDVMEVRRKVACGKSNPSHNWEI